MKNWIIELWHFRELLWALTLKEIKIRYKQTILGVAWAILQPAALTIIFTVVFGIFLKVNSGDIPYPIFAYSALLPWTFFTTAVSFGALSVVNNGNLVTKVYFPREILPFSAVFAAFFDFLMASIIFLIMLLYYKIDLTLNLFLLIIPVVSILLFTAGISLLLSALNVLFRDIRFVVPLILQIWLYATPVIYPLDQVPQKYKFLMLFNPMTSLIESFRNFALHKGSVSGGMIFLSIIVSVLTFMLGYLFFKYRERVFADVI